MRAIKIKLLIIFEMAGAVLLEGVSRQGLRGGDDKSSLRCVKWESISQVEWAGEKARILTC